MRRVFFAVAMSVWAAAPCAAQTQRLEVIVDGGSATHKDFVLRVPLNVPKDWAKQTAVIVSVDAGSETYRTVGQLTSAGITTRQALSTPAAKERRDLHLVLRDLPAKSTRKLTIDVSKQVESKLLDPSFSWVDTKEGLHELVQSRSGTTHRVLRYMNAAFDDSTKDQRDRTYKVFHHLYDPDGKRFVTNGGHTDLMDGEKRKLTFPHHRGIMFGFNKCTYGPDLKRKADTWHCTGDAHVAHEKFLAEEAGPVLGRQRVQVGWHGEKKERFAQEEREVAVYNLEGGTLVEFATRLTTPGGRVRLDGDPQHAGFQFRAANDVAEKTAKQTYYLRPDGKGEPGKTRNWPQDKTMVDLPWYAMSFVLDGQRYTVCYLNHPKNPKESRFSERDYGRFGGYFEYDLTPETPLELNYRLWLHKGEMTLEQAQALYDAFATPPRFSVK
jgi:hypothetical protein